MLINKMKIHLMFFCISSCHIINLIVKSGLKRLKEYVVDYITTILFLNASNQRVAAYKQYFSLFRPHKFGVDMYVI
jgi:hypothetical protein